MIDLTGKRLTNSTVEGLLTSSISRYFAPSRDKPLHRDQPRHRDTVVLRISKFLALFLIVLVVTVFSIMPAGAEPLTLAAREALEIATVGEEHDPDSLDEIEADLYRLGMLRMSGELRELISERDAIKKELREWIQNQNEVESQVWVYSRAVISSAHVHLYKTVVCKAIDQYERYSVAAEGAFKAINENLEAAREIECRSEQDLNKLRSNLQSATESAAHIEQLVTSILARNSRQFYELLRSYGDREMQSKKEVDSAFRKLQDSYSKYLRSGHNLHEIKKRWDSHKNDSDRFIESAINYRDRYNSDIFQQFADQAACREFQTIFVNLGGKVSQDITSDSYSMTLRNQYQKAVNEYGRFPKNWVPCEREQKELYQFKNTTRDFRDWSVLNVAAIDQLYRECEARLSDREISHSTGGIFIHGPSQLSIGDSGSFVAKDAGNRAYKDVHWITTDESVIALDPASGRFNANRAGVCTIIARKGDLAGHLRVKVQPAAAAPTQPECRSDDDCPIAYVCVEGRCLHLGKHEVLDNETTDTPECFRDSECALGQECIDDRCTTPLNEDTLRDDVFEWICTDDNDCRLGEKCVAGTCFSIEERKIEDVLKLFGQREDQRQQELLEREGDELSHSRRGRIDSHELQHEVDKLRRRAERAARKDLKPTSRPQAPADSDDDSDPPPKPGVQPPAETKPPADVQPPVQPPRDTLQRDWYIFEVTAKWSSPYNGEACHWIFYNQNHGPAADIPRYQNALEEMLRGMVADKPYVDMNTLQITSEVYAGPSESKMEVPSGSTYWPTGVTR